MLTLMMATFFLCAVSPFALGVLFLATLFVRAVLIGLLNGFLGLILFIVYVGGTIVLFTYCFMLSPKQAFGGYSNLYPFGLLAAGLAYISFGRRGARIEFYWIINVLLLVGIILFVVILRVVEIVDFSRGSMRVE